MDSFTIFDESQLPTQAALFSKLSDSRCPDTEYAHATQVWTAFECESMTDYRDIYVKCDVLLLADFFEKFRATCLAHYNLDDVHYYTAPGLTWDATLRMTYVSLELIMDIDKYPFIEKSILGGISMITTRYAQTNFPTLLWYDASRPHVHLIYLDANNLYGWAMSQPLPTGGFRFLQLDEIEALAPVRELSDDAEDGYMRLISTIHNIYTTLATTTHPPPSRWRSIASSDERPILTQNGMLGKSYVNKRTIERIKTTK